VLFGERGGKVLQGNGGRGSCFLRHIWPSSWVLAWWN
jgi:hypothetical protein